MLSCSIWFCAPSFWMGGGLEIRCVGHVYGADGALWQRLSRPPPIQKLGAENHMLQLNIQCSWWWAYVPETCRAKNASIKLPCCIKLAFHFISRVWKFARMFYNHLSMKESLHLLNSFLELNDTADIYKTGGMILTVLLVRNVRE